jgi:SAM-dependent methyltransferase/4-amino-4-deoxy-L-arabinose transferase-like glycosyltransferase
MSTPLHDPLWDHLKGVPAFRALLRAVESRFYRDLELPRPMLDLGCGDGHFARTTFSTPPEVGVDPWWRPLREARERESYGLSVQAQGGRLPFAEGQFATVISNSVLEHIPDVEEVLSEAARVLQGPEEDGPGVRLPGKLVITVPSEHFSGFLSISGFLRQVGLDRAAAAYEGWFNRISRHHHCDPPSLWHQRLGAAGLRTVSWQYYFSPSAHHRLEWGHYLGLPSLVSKLLFGRWVLAPWRSSLKWTERWLRPSFDEPPPEKGAYLLFVAERMGPGESRGPLPAPSPRAFVQTELTKELVVQEIAEPVALPEAAPPIEVKPTLEPRGAGVSTGPSITSLAWLGLAVLFAVLGQISWNWYTRPYKPADGLTWYGLALLMLALFAWQSAPRGGRTALRVDVGVDSALGWLGRQSVRGLVVLASLVCSLLARHSVGDAIQTSDGGRGALLWWLGGIALMLLALWPGALTGLGRWVRHRLLPEGRRGGGTLRPAGALTWRSWNRWELLGLCVLVLAAFLVRFVKLDEIPYVLAGDEASMGREAVRVLSGELGNPFITGWFSHPTLFSYILVLPVRALGQTTLAVRFLSPFIGALTVLATYLFARRAWGRAVAWIAAALLAGYHFHIHYSRLALNNIWDPLFALLVMGLLWRSWQTRDRRCYVMAGLALGVSQYFYMGARLLLVLVGALVLYWALKDGRRLWRERSSLVAFVLMAAVVALPIALFSVKHPDDYMARMNQLGIFHSGWLTREVELTGRSAAGLLGEQLWKAALAFNYTVDPTFWYRPGIPLLRFWPSILFVFGLGLALVRIRRTPDFLLLLWIAATVLFAGALLENPPSSQRYVIASPAICLLVAVSLVWVGERLRALLGGRQAMWLGSVTLLALLFVWGDLRFYFGEYTREGDYGGLNTEVAQRASDYLRDLGPEWRVFFFGFPRMGISAEGGFPTVPFLAPDVDSVDVMETLEDPYLLPGFRLPATFLFLPERAYEIKAVRERFPNGVEKHFPGRYDRLLFVAYEVENPE